MAPIEFIAELVGIRGLIVPVPAAALDARPDEWPPLQDALDRRDERQVGFFVVDLNAPARYEPAKVVAWVRGAMCLLMADGGRVLPTIAVLVPVEARRSFEGRRFVRMLTSAGAILSTASLQGFSDERVRHVDTRDQREPAPTAEAPGQDPPTAKDLRRVRRRHGAMSLTKFNQHLDAQG